MVVVLGFSIGVSIFFPITQIRFLPAGRIGRFIEVVRATGDFILVNFPIVLFAIDNFRCAVLGRVGLKIEWVQETDCLHRTAINPDPLWVGITNPLN